MVGYAGSVDPFEAIIVKHEHRKQQRAHVRGPKFFKQALPQWFKPGNTWGDLIDDDTLPSPPVGGTVHYPAQTPILEETEDESESESGIGIGNCLVATPNCSEMGQSQDQSASSGTSSTVVPSPVSSKDSIILRSKRTLGRASIRLKHGFKRESTGSLLAKVVRLF